MTVGKRNPRVAGPDGLGGHEPAATPSVQYVYGDGGVGGVAAYVRLTDVIYPAAPGPPAAATLGTVTGPQPQWTTSCLAWLRSVKATERRMRPSRTLARTRIASERLQQPQIELDYSASNFAALDRFGDVLDQVWASYGSRLGRHSGYPAHARRLQLHLRPAGNRTTPGQRDRSVT